MVGKKTLYIDGDGCNQNTRELAERLVHRGVRVVIVANRDIPCTQKTTEFVKCGMEMDAADLYIMQHCEDGDLVITRDLQLSAKLLHTLHKTIYVMSDNGEVYTSDMILARIKRAEYSKTQRMIVSAYDQSPRGTIQTPHKKQKSKQNKNPVADYLEQWRLGLIGE